MLCSIMLLTRRLVEQLVSPDTERDRHTTTVVALGVTLSGVTVGGHAAEALE